MCYYCNKNDVFDIGWLEVEEIFYSCCYDCGLKEKGDFTDSIPTNSVKRGANNPKSLTPKQEQIIINYFKQRCMICHKEITNGENFPYDFYCSKECEKRDTNQIETSIIKLGDFE